MCISYEYSEFHNERIHVIHKLTVDVAEGEIFENQRLGWWRRGRLQKMRPLAFTNAAIAKLMLAHIKENNRFHISTRTTREQETDQYQYVDT